MSQSDKQRFDVRHSNIQDFDLYFDSSSTKLQTQTLCSIAVMPTLIYWKGGAKGSLSVYQPFKILVLWTFMRTKDNVTSHEIMWDPSASRQDKSFLSIQLLGNTSPTLFHLLIYSILSLHYLIQQVLFPKTWEVNKLQNSDCYRSVTFKCFVFFHIVSPAQSKRRRVTGGSLPTITQLHQGHHSKAIT